jgi:predicted GTPase
MNIPGPDRSRTWLVPVVAVLAALPFLVLLAAGLFGLWRQGWLLWWILGAAAASALAWIGMRFLRRPLQFANRGEEPVSGPDPGWAPRELKAWETVRELSADANPDMLADRRRLLDGARETVEAVARCYHPEQEDPVWEFTLPEFLLLTERISARMRAALLEHVPFSHEVRAGLVLRAWGYRPIIESGLAHGRRLYGLLRIMRTINPLAALAAELRDRFMGELSEAAQEYLLRKVARIWIEETGRAAIELYSGRLRVDAERMRAAAATDDHRPIAATPALPGPLRLLVAGQTKAGKSSLVNALLGELAAGVDVLPLTAEFTGYELRRDGETAMLVIDSPGIEDPEGTAEVLRRVVDCDLLLWVVPAHRADRAIDRSALDSVRAWIDSDPGRRMPPLLVIASHVDRLSPAREWQPPYDVAYPAGAKAASIRAALEAISADLVVPIDSIVPVKLDGPRPYNLEVVEMRLAELLDDARRARWLRIHRRLAEGRDWRQTLKQFAGAGRIVTGILRR